MGMPVIARQRGGLMRMSLRRQRSRSSSLLNHQKATRMMVIKFKQVEIIQFKMKMMSMMRPSL
jgi:hypothetical protein